MELTKQITAARCLNRTQHPAPPSWGRASIQTATPGCRRPAHRSTQRGTAAVPHVRAPPGPPGARPWPCVGQEVQGQGRKPLPRFLALLGRPAGVKQPSFAHPVSPGWMEQSAASDHALAVFCVIFRANQRRCKCRALRVPAPARAESTRAPVPAPCRGEKFPPSQPSPNRAQHPAPPRWKPSARTGPPSRSRPRRPRVRDFNPARI